MFKRETDDVHWTKHKLLINKGKYIEEVYTCTICKQTWTNLERVTKHCPGLFQYNAGASGEQKRPFYLRTRKEMAIMNLTLRKGQIAKACLYEKEHETYSALYDIREIVKDENSAEFSEEFYEEDEKQREKNFYDVLTSDDVRILHDRYVWLRKAEATEYINEIYDEIISLTRFSISSRDIQLLRDKLSNLRGEMQRIQSGEIDTTLQWRYPKKENKEIIRIYADKIFTLQEVLFFIDLYTEKKWFLKK